MTAIEISETVSLTEQFYISLKKVQDGERIRSCIQCGSCSGVCPYGYWMDFTPRRIIASLRTNQFGDVIKNDTLWMCMSCYACTAFCPSQIPLTAGLMTRSKEELLLAGNVPPELKNALENTQRYGNPLGESHRKRADWTKDILPEVTIMSKARKSVDTLWFVGDYPSYHPRVQMATKAMARILNTLGVNFGILGSEENSDGDSQRLAGERGLFEMLAERNGETFKDYEFKQIITTDPHAYNAIKNEYPKLGYSYPIQHYTQFLFERLEQLKPLLKKEINAKIAYHDPCYLGRVNDIYNEPRALLQAIPGVELIEMFHNHKTSLCCGGGGGGMWLDGFLWEKAQARPSEWRLHEAVNAGAEILAVACPYETPRFEDAAKTVPGADQIVIKDVIELLAEAME